MTPTVRDRLKPMRSPRVQAKRGSPVAWWLTDRVLGSCLPDITAGRNKGTPTLSGGAGISIAPGLFGPRLSFSHTSGAYIAVPGAAIPASVRSFTCRFRSDATAAGNDCDIFYAHPASGTLWGVVVTGATKTSLIVNNGSFVAQVTATIVPHTEYHLAVTTDGTTIKVYLNGALAASAASSLTLAGPGPSGFGTIGNFTPTAPSEPWFGFLDDIRLYDYTLNASQVAREYANPWWRLAIDRAFPAFRLKPVFDIFGPSVIIPRSSTVG